MTKLIRAHEHVILILCIMKKRISLLIPVIIHVSIIIHPSKLLPRALNFLKIPQRQNITAAGSSGIEQGSE